jgi:hypothetical protein
MAKKWASTKGSSAQCRSSIRRFTDERGKRDMTDEVNRERLRPVGIREWDRRVSEDHPVQSSVVVALVIFVGLVIVELLMGEPKPFLYPIVFGAVFGIGTYFGQRMRRAPRHD